MSSRRFAQGHIGERRQVTNEINEVGVCNVVNVVNAVIEVNVVDEVIGAIDIT